MSHFIETASVSFETALRAVQLGIEEGEKQGIKVIVTVSDTSMNPVAYGRADGSTPHSIETSRRKAATSASTRKATGYMQGELATALPMGTGQILTNIRGGFPLVFEGRHVGGLGIAGGLPDQDAEIALAVLERLGAEIPA